MADVTLGLRLQFTQSMDPKPLTLKAEGFFGLRVQRVEGSGLSWSESRVWGGLGSWLPKF